MSTYDNRPFQAGDQQYQNNLIINYLPQSLADDDFRKIFERIGEVRSAKIVRNRATLYSFGYGFVEYANAEDAVRAIEELNGLQLENKRIKVAFSRPQSNDTNNSKIMVKNLENSNLEALNEVFSKFGSIVQSYIAPSGVAFVLFEKRESAEQAINDLDGTVLPGGSQPLEIKFAFNKNRQYNGGKFQNNDYQPNQNVRPMRQYNTYSTSPNFRSSNGRPPRYQQGGSSNYDAYSSRDSQSGDAYGGPIRNNFQYGNRSNHSSRYNPMGSSYGQQVDSTGGSQYSQYRANNYGNYGGYSNNANYSGQSRGYQGYQQGGRNEDQSGYTMFVYNVAQSTDADLNMLFSQFGPVSSSSVIQGKGFGFVTMENYEHAQNAIQGLNDTTVNGQKIQVSFKKARRG